MYTRLSALILNDRLTIVPKFEMPIYPSEYLLLLDALFAFGLALSLVSLYLLLSKYRILLRVIWLVGITAGAISLVMLTYAQLGYYLEGPIMPRFGSLALGPVPLYFMVISVVASLTYLAVKRPAGRRGLWMVVLLIAQIAIGCIVWMINNIVHQEMFG